MENKFNFKAGERVIFTAWGTYELAAQALECGAEVIFCDIDLTCGDADVCHLKELCANGASKFFALCDGAAALFARGIGVEVIVLDGKERIAEVETLPWRGFEDIMRGSPCEKELEGVEVKKLSPVYDGEAFRFATPPDGQYPYYMLYLDGVETLCRECVRILKK